jgi:hypothetical protein
MKLEEIRMKTLGAVDNDNSGTLIAGIHSVVHEHKKDAYTCKRQVDFQIDIVCCCST